MKLLASIVDFLWPPCCPLCRRAMLEDVFCGDCGFGLPRIPAGERVLMEDGPLDFVGALFRYDEPVRGLLLSLKYAQDPHPARALGRLVADELLAVAPGGHLDGIVPIPLTRRRFRERGYNQALLLAEEIGRRSGLPVLETVLMRPVHREPQASLTGAKRRRNLEGVFRADRVFARSILLVDDVITTGTTLREAATTLRASGARRVSAIGVCRADARTPNGA